MNIGYSSEKLHHALHPLFLNINPHTQYRVGRDDETTLWYISEEQRNYRIRKDREFLELPKDLYTVKRFIYDFYRRTEDIALPWGIVSGIRPSKLARKLWESDTAMTLAEFQNQLWQLDRIRADKAELLWDVIRTENRYLADSEPSSSGIHLYIGIPFCPSRCYYCSFAAGVLKEEDEKLVHYVELLEKEIDGLQSVWQEREIKTIYIGGGTPTLLSEKLLQRLLDKLTNAIAGHMPLEFTVEAGRPDTITAAKLDVLKRYGVNRISINPQSFSDSTLAKIGRFHSVDQVYRAYELAKEREFVINMDLIFGLEGEGEAELEHTWEKIKMLSPENVTVHTLTPKRGADLSYERREQIHRRSKEIGLMLDKWRENMRQSGWRPYYLYRQKNIYFENVGYAKPGTECIYNMETMLERQSVIALGAGSISKRIAAEKTTRYDMPKDFIAYEKAVTDKMEKKRAFFRN